jgi:hypothetical protein
LNWICWKYCIPCAGELSIFTPLKNEENEQKLRILQQQEWRDMIAAKGKHASGRGLFVYRGSRLLRRVLRNV